MQLLSRLLGKISYDISGISISQKSPPHIVFSQFLLIEKKQIIRIVIGSEIIAMGKECLVYISTIIHNIEPMQKDPYPINKYKNVPLDLSNLLKQDMNRPGNIMLVTGIQAHFLQNYGVIEGKTKTKGLQNVLMTKLLYEILSAQCTTSPAMIQITNKENNINTPNLSERILNILIHVTVVQMARKSFIIHIPFVSQQIATLIMPNVNDIISILRTGPKQADRINLLLVSHSVQEVHTATPITPIRLPIIFKNMLVKLGVKNARTEPSTSIALNTITNVLLTLIPNPAQDHALLQNEDKVIVIVQKQISINRPHSKGLQNQSGQQLTKNQN